MRRSLLPSLAAPRGAIMMSAVHDAARQAWHARFANRAKPPAAPVAKLDVRASDGATEIMLYAEIGYWGITAEHFNKVLAEVTTPRIVLRINSPGGDVFDGYAMYHALRAHPATVECVVEGLAASAASFVALAGETLVMSDPSMLMIHRAWTFAMGNVNDMNAVAARLSKVDGQIADLYAAKTGKPAADMLALMDAETWMTAKEAAELGFVDEIDDPEEDADADAKAQASVHTARLRAARLVELGIR